MQEITSHMILEESLPIIDNFLSNQNEALNIRPLSATVLFEKYFIVGIEDENKDHSYDFYDSPLFSAFLNYITEWYRKRYGDAFEKNKLRLNGLVFIHNHPFEIQFPYSMTIDEGDEETISLIMLSEFRAEEDWKEYIVSNPNLDLLDTSTLRIIEREVMDAVELSRHILHNFCFVDTDSNELKAMAVSIPSHINNAVFHVVSASCLEFNFALWEFHLALEKSLKILVMQNIGSFPQSHDLVKLFSLTEFSSNTTLNNLISSFPNHKRVINLRYSESDFQDIHEIREIYLNALKILYDVSNLIKKKFTMHEATIYIKRLKHSGCKLVD